MLGGASAGQTAPQDIRFIFGLASQTHHHIDFSFTTSSYSATPGWLRLTSCRAREWLILGDQGDGANEEGQLCVPI
jgi:hypothetical protein